MDDTLATISTSSTPREITPLITFAPSGVDEERIQELLCLQQANLEETMERRFIAKCMETNLLIEKTLESSLKSFNDFVLYNMNLLMQQRLPSSVQQQYAPTPQPPLPPPTTIVQPHPEVPAPMVPSSEATIFEDHMSAPLPSPSKSSPPIPQPPSTEGSP